MDEAVARADEEGRDYCGSPSYAPEGITVPSSPEAQIGICLTMLDPERLQFHLDEAGEGTVIGITNR